MSAHSNSPLTSPSGPRRLSPQTKPISAGSTSNRDEGSDTKRGRQSSARFQVKELGRETWPDFERMVEKHNGVGTVDGYPIALPKGKKYSNSFIWGGTESMYLNQGFRPLGSFGASNRVMVMRKVVRGR